MTEKIKLPKVYCPFCKKYTIAQITTMIHEKSKLKVSIIGCPLCGNALNIDKKVKIDWITEEEANKMGWHKVED